MFVIPCRFNGLNVRKLLRPFLDSIVSGEFGMRRRGISTFPLHLVSGLG